MPPGTVRRVQAGAGSPRVHGGATGRSGRAVLIDATHKRWAGAALALGAAAVAVYELLARGAPGGLTGGSAAGLWYGVIGSGLMVYAGLLAAHRKVPSWWWVGARQTWLRGHIWL